MNDEINAWLAKNRALGGVETYESLQPYIQVPAQSRVQAAVSRMPTAPAFVSDASDFVDEIGSSMIGAIHDVIEIDDPFIPAELLTTEAFSSKLGRIRFPNTQKRRDWFSPPGIGKVRFS